MFYPRNLLLCCVLVTSKSQMFRNEGIGYSIFTSSSAMGWRSEDCSAPPIPGSLYQWAGDLRTAQLLPLSALPASCTHMILLSGREERIAGDSFLK